MSTYVLTAQQLRNILIHNMGWEEEDLATFKKLAREFSESKQVNAPRKRGALPSSSYQR